MTTQHNLNTAVGLTTNMTVQNYPTIHPTTLTFIDHKNIINNNNNKNIINRKNKFYNNNSSLKKYLLNHN